MHDQCSPIEILAIRDTGCLISSVMVSNLHKIIIFYSSEAEILDLDISKLYILVFKISLIIKQILLLQIIERFFSGICNIQGLKFTNCFKLIFLT